MNKRLFAIFVLLHLLACDDTVVEETETYSTKAEVVEKYVTATCQWAIDCGYAPADAFQTCYDYGMDKHCAEHDCSVLSPTPDSQIDACVEAYAEGVCGVQPDACVGIAANN